MAAGKKKKIFMHIRAFGTTPCSSLFMFTRKVIMFLVSITWYGVKSTDSTSIGLPYEAKNTLWNNVYVNL